MCVRNCVRKGLCPSLPPHTQIYALVCTLPPSIDAYVIKVWPLKKDYFISYCKIISNADDGHQIHENTDSPVFLLFL